MRSWVASFRPAQRSRENLGNRDQMGPAATSPRTGHLFAYLALSFMTRSDLHDRGTGRRNREPYELSFCPRTSIGLPSSIGITERLMTKSHSRDRANPRSLRVHEMSLPPGKRDGQRDTPVELRCMEVVVRRPLIRLVCSHAKNWVADSAHELFFTMNPLCSVMKGFMVATMNPLSWDVCSPFHLV
jgi:hypothetical protein